MDAFEHLNDDELLERTATEPEAFGTFYRRRIGGVLGFFRRRTGDAQLALDLAEGLFAPQGAPLTGTVVRFLQHQRLPLDDSTRHLLTMSDHAGAKTISLGRSRCAGR